MNIIKKGRCFLNVYNKERMIAILDVFDYLFLFFFSVFVVYYSLTHFIINWDSLAYHLPFASRLADIYQRSDFILTAPIEARYNGYPLLVEALEGWLWRLFNNIGATNLVNLIAFISFSIYLKSRNKLSIILVSIFYFSIPLAYIQFFSSYIDLFVNTFLALAFIAFYNFIIKKEKVDFYACLSFLFIANNSKYTALFFSIVCILTLVFFLKKEKNKKFLVVLFLSSFLIFFPQIKNIIKFENPIYPNKPPLITSLFSNIPYTEVIDNSQVPSYLKNSPNILKFFYSLFEINSYDATRTQRWLIDQGSSPSSKAFRMGGYFYLNIVIWIILFFKILLIGVKKDKGILMPCVAIVLLTFLSGFMPQSHELRYSLYLPILLTVFILTNINLFGRWIRVSIIGIQLAIVIFVFIQLYPIKSSKLPPYDEYNLKKITKENTCLYNETINATPFLYRISTPKKIKIQYINNKSECIFVNFLPFFNYPQ